MSQAMDNTRINLIIAGGGVRLSAYVGALAAFEEMGVEVVGIAGASAGSIVGSLMAAGWSVEKMYRLMMDTDLTQFKDFSLRALMFQNGIYSGNRFEKWMVSQLEGAKFKDMRRDLYVTAVDLISQQPVFFSRHATPEASVGKAVRFSMSIPGVWSAQRWEGKVLVDGNLVPWIPAAIKEIQANQNSGAPDRTVMLRMVSDEPEELPLKKHLWPWDFAKVLLDTMLTALDNQRVPGWLWQDTILIHTGNIHTLQFSLSPADKEHLFQCGYEQAKRYFHKKVTLVPHPTEALS